MESPADRVVSSQTTKWLPVSRRKASSTAAESDTRAAARLSATRVCAASAAAADRRAASQAAKPTLASTAASTSPTTGATNCRVSEEWAVGTGMRRIPRPATF